jgi:hypothetical protein
VSHHRAALRVVTAAVGLDVILGALYSLVTPGLPLWHGLYCALANAVTVGGDVTPVNGSGYLVQASECALVVPLFAATFSLFTSGLTGTRVAVAEKRIQDHTEARLRHHLSREASERLHQPGTSPMHPPA